MNEIIVGRSKADTKKFGTEGTVYLGKHYVQMGSTTSLSNKIYLDMLRSHVVFVSGKRGGGKCLTGETRITLANGQWKKIKDLNGTEELLSLGEDLKVGIRAADAFYSREAESLLHLNLRSGKKISLTPEHPLLTVQGWLEAQTLTIGSRIATPRIQPVWGDNALAEHEVKLIAYLLAEGHLSNKIILFSNTDEKIIKEYEESVQSFDKELSLTEHSKGSYRITGRKAQSTLTIPAQDERGQFTKETRIDNRSAIRKWLDKHEMYGKLAHERRIPACIYTLPKQQLSTFLNRLFSCDGSIYKEGELFWKVSYSSSSEEFINEIQHLLSRFGVIAVKRQKKTKRRDHYELTVKGEFVNTFLQEIGFFGAKEKRACVALKESVKIIRNPNTDTIPKDVWNSFKPANWAEIGRKVGYAHPKAIRESTRYSPSRQKLLQIGLVAQEENLVTLAKSDIYWDEVIGIKKEENPVTVYDLTVPETHNFIADDIIVHNSYTMGVIAEGMADLPQKIKKNLSIIMLDTMGIYWTMKYPNMKDKLLLKNWGLEGKALDVSIFTPSGYYQHQKDEGIPTDFPFAIQPSELNGTDWNQTFSIDSNSREGVLIESVIHDLEGNYDIDDITKAINERNYDDTAKQAVLNHFRNAKGWGLFDKEGTKLSELAKPGRISVLDVSVYATQEQGWNIKSLVIGLVAQKLFNQRMQARKDEEYQDVHAKTTLLDEEEQSTPLVWLVIDEAHEFMPNQGKTLATDPLVTILREGRQPGISLILATQQPGKIHTDVMTQSDIILSHRITAKIDTDALGMLMQSYMRTGIDKELDHLPREKGAALILDDNNEKMYPMQVRPRFTWHGGEAPTALKKKEELFDF